MCLEYGVSRMTARRSLSVLESEGLVYRDGTRGTFVAEPRIEVGWESPAGDISESGRRHRVEPVSAEERPADFGQALILGIDRGAVIYAMQRVHLSNDAPLDVETTYCPADLAPGLLDGEQRESPGLMLRRFRSLHPAKIVASVDAVVLDESASRILQTRQSAAGLRRVRRTYAKDGRCIHYTEEIYRAGRVSLVVERTLVE